MIHCSPAQEASPAGQEKKVDNAPAKPATGIPGSDPAQMQNMTRKMMGGRSGGKMGNMMGQMGQPDKSGQATEPTLEEMLNKALKDNPDIRVADAKVREAEAELNRTRLQVTQKVLAFHYSRESQRAVLKFAEENMLRIQKLKATNAISQEDVKVAEQQLSAAKAKLAEIEAEMPYLLGEQHGLKVSTTVDRQVQLWDTMTGKAIQIKVPLKLEHAYSKPEPDLPIPESGTVSEKLRKAMDTPITLDYRDKSLAEILEDLEKKVPGVSFHALYGNPFSMMTLKGQYPLRTALQLIEDTCSAAIDVRYAFVVRDYGLLFCPEDKIPPGALRLQTFITGQYIPIEEFAPGPWRSPIIEKTPAKKDKSQETPKK
jgi:hypothetical protein